MAYRSSTTLAGAGRVDSTFTAPSGIVNGDVLLLLLTTTFVGGVTPTPPSGFTALSISPVTITNGADPNLMKLFGWYKVASGESGSYTATHSISFSEGILYCFSGRNTTTPISPTPTSNSSGNSTTSATGLTTTTANSDVVFVSVAWDGQGGSAPTGTTPTFTERYDGGLVTGAIYAADGNLAAAGATGDKINTNNNQPPDDSTAPYVAWLVALAQATPAFTKMMGSGGMAGVGSLMVGRSGLAG